MRSSRAATKSSPRSPQLQKACTQQWRPDTAKTIIIIIVIIVIMVGNANKEGQKRKTKDCTYAWSSESTSRVDFPKVWGHYFQPHVLLQHFAPPLSRGGFYFPPLGTWWDLGAASLQAWLPRQGHKGKKPGSPSEPTSGLRHHVVRKPRPPEGPHAKSGSSHGPSQQPTSPASPVSGQDPFRVPAMNCHSWHLLRQGHPSRLSSAGQNCRSVSKNKCHHFRLLRFGVTGYASLGTETDSSNWDR